MNKIRSGVAVKWGIAIGALAVCLAACGSKGTVSADGHQPSADRSVAYVPDYTDRISAFSIDGDTGALSAIAGSPFAAPQGLALLAVHPSGKFAYIVHTTDDYISDQISGYSIDGSTGALSLLPGSPFVTSDPHVGSFATLAFDPTGRFAFVANGTQDNIAVYAVSADSGALTEIAGSPFAAGGGPVSIAVHPSGRFVYAANARSYEISIYSADSTTGALTPLQEWPSIAGRELVSIAIDPSGKFAFVALQNTDEVAAFSLDPLTGALTSVPGSPYPAALWPSAVAVDLSGKFVFVVNRGSDSIGSYSIKSAGALAEVFDSPFPTGDMPTTLALDPSGKFVYVVNSYSQSISAFSIVPGSGELLGVRGSPFPTGIIPWNVAIVRLPE